MIKERRRRRSSPKWIDSCLTGWALDCDIQEILAAAINDLMATIFLQLVRRNM